MTVCVLRKFVIKDGKIYLKTKSGLIELTFDMWKKSCLEKGVEKW